LHHLLRVFLLGALGELGGKIGADRTWVTLQ
jgi:hypothetical protein